MNHCKTCKRKVNKIIVDVYNCKCKCLSVYYPKHCIISVLLNTKKEQQNRLRKKIPVIESNKGLLFKL